MFLRTTIIVLGMICLAQTVAGVPSSARRVRGLHLRSLPPIPAACQAGCRPFTPFLQGASCPVTECCSTIFENGYAACFKCIGTELKATDFSLAQEYVDVLTTSCITEGFPLPELTLPGQNPERTLATALPPDASNIPIFTSGSPATPSSSAVRHSTTSAPSRSAHSGSATASHSGASQISGSASTTSAGASVPGSPVFSTASDGSVGTDSASSIPSGSSGAASQGSVTAPASQSTATSPSTVSSGAPGPTNSNPSAAFRPRARSKGVACLVALLALHGLLA